MRAWWLRTVLVLHSPRAVFVALRDDDPESAAQRSEPVLMIVLLAGIAFVLSTRAAGRLMDDHDYDSLLVAVWALLAGFLYGAVAYWLFGGVLQLVVRRFGSRGSYRRSRHLLAFAWVPIALSLVLWPLKLAAFGSDVFRSGGSDSGTGGAAFAVLTGLFGVWSLALLLIGVRAVHGWTWSRAVAATATATLVPVALVVVPSAF
jgi:hypothetical protein